jgi:hypothetical protein
MPKFRMRNETDDKKEALRNGVEESKRREMMERNLHAAASRQSRIPSERLPE